MVAVSVRLPPVPTTVEATLPTTTTSMVAIQEVPQHVPIMVVEQRRTIMTNTVAVLGLPQPDPTMAVVTQRITTISMAAVQEVPRHVLTMVEELPPITTTNMVAASVRQPLAPTIVVALPQPITTLTAIASVQVMTGNNQPIHIVAILQPASKLRPCF